MEKTVPTRQQLLFLRAQRLVIRKGLELLKSKREALMKEFFGIVEESVKMRAELTGLLSKAQRDASYARAPRPGGGILRNCGQARRYSRH